MHKMFALVQILCRYNADERYHEVFSYYASFKLCQTPCQFADVVFLFVYYVLIKKMYDMSMLLICDDEKNTKDHKYKKKASGQV